MPTVLSEVEQAFLDYFREAISRCPCIPEGFYDSFQYTETGKNFTHPRTVGLIAKACWRLPMVLAVDMDVRYNLGSGKKFQPDVAVLCRTTSGGTPEDNHPMLVIDYESPNSSDARIIKKDLRNYLGWARSRLVKKRCDPPPYLIITTLPRQADSKKWQVRWANKGQWNYGHWRNRAEIAESPANYWYGFYRSELAKLSEDDCRIVSQFVYFLNLNGAKVEPEQVL